MGVSDRLPENLIPNIKLGRDEFHRRTRVRRFGAGVALRPVLDDASLLLVVGEFKTPDGEFYTQLELPGGGLTLVDAMKERWYTEASQPFTPWNLDAYMQTARDELKQEAMIDPNNVTFTGKTALSNSVDAGPDNYVAFEARGNDIDIRRAINTPSEELSNEVKSIGLYSLYDILKIISEGDIEVHHAVESVIADITTGEWQ